MQNNKQNFNRKHTHPNFHSCEGGGTKHKEQTWKWRWNQWESTLEKHNVHHYHKTSSNVVQGWLWMIARYFAGYEWQLVPRTVTAAV